MALWEGLLDSRPILLSAVHPVILWAFLGSPILVGSLGGPAGLRDRGDPQLLHVQVFPVWMGQEGEHAPVR